MKILNGGIQVVCELTKENIWRLQGEGKLFGSLMCMYVGVAYFVNDQPWYILPDKRNSKDNKISYFMKRVQLKVGKM